MGTLNKLLAALLVLGGLSMTLSACNTSANDDTPSQRSTPEDPSGTDNNQT